MGRKDGGIHIRRLTSDTQYADDAGAVALTTTYEYAHTQHFLAQAVTATPPVVPTSQHGSGQAEPVTQYFDPLGRLSKTNDKIGNVTHTLYDPVTGGIKTTIVNDGGKSLATTNVTIDKWGRATEVQEPNGNRFTIKYLVQGPRSAVITSPEANDPTVAGPKQAVLTDAATGDVFTYSFWGTTLYSLTITHTDYAGRTVAQDRYWDLTGLGVLDATTGLLTFAKDNQGKELRGLLTTPANPAAGNYYRTEYRYDGAGRQYWTKDAVGTVTQLSYDAWGRVVNTYVGVANELSATTPVSTNEYDNGSIGDSNLTKVTLNPNYTGQPNRVTVNVYDWRDRLVASKAGDVRITASDYNNLNEVVSSAVYVAAGLNVADFASGSYTPPIASRRALTETDFDNHGRAYCVHTYSILQQDYQSGVDVIPAGAIDNCTHADIWYDARGNVVKESAPGGLVTRTQYDGAGRVKQQDVGSEDTVLERTITTYDEAHHSVLVTFQQRQSDGTYRSSYTGAHYDAVGRVAFTVDYGTANPGAAPASEPARSATTLVTSYAYNPSARTTTVTNPSNVKTRVTYDAAGRTVKEDDDCGASLPGHGSERKITFTTYNGVDQVTSSKVQNWSSSGLLLGYPETRYTYENVCEGSNSPFTHQTTFYPDGSHEIRVYDALGDLVAWLTTSGALHKYSYDGTGRLIADETPPALVPDSLTSTVKALTWDYDALDRLTLATSWGDANKTQPLNQVKRQYNGFGQITTEWQAHNGAVDTATPNGTPYLAYAYDTAGNGSRLVSVTFTNHGDEHCTIYGYSGLDAQVSRVSSVAVDTASNVVEQYAYLGLSSIVQRTRPATGQPDLTVELDSLDRVSTWKWSNGTSLVDGYAYQYNCDGRVHSVADLEWFAETTYPGTRVLTYDALGREKSDSWGHLAIEETFTKGNVLRVTTESWDLDSAGTRSGGKYGSVSGSSGLPTDSSYSPDGNARSLRFGNSKSKITFDAWGRLCEIKDVTPSFVSVGRGTGDWSYKYDALGRRIVTTNDGTPSDAYYYGSTLLYENTEGYYVWSPDGHLIERVGPGGQAAYALYDQNGSTTALVGTSGADAGKILQRFVYDADGAPYVVAADHTNVAADTAQCHWTILYLGQRYVTLFRWGAGHEGSSVPLEGGGGLSMDAAGGWTNAATGMGLRPVHVGTSPAYRPNTEPAGEWSTFGWALGGQMLTRIVGLVQAGFGVAEIVVGAEASSTLIGAFVGVPVFFHGCDDVATGLYSAYTGESQATLTQQAATAIALGAGADPTAARWIGVGVDLGIGLGGYSAAARLAKAAAAARTTAAFGQSFATGAEWEALLASRYGAGNVTWMTSTALRNRVYGNLLANRTVMGAIERSGGLDALEAAERSVEMAAVREAGKAGELAAGANGAKIGVLGPISGRMRFPDALGAVLKEAKNVKYQGLTSQIKDYIAIAQARGIPFELWVRVQNGTRISRPLEAAEKAGRLRIVRGI